MWRSFLLATPPRPACLCDSGLYTVRALGRFLAIRAISHLHIVAVMDRGGTQITKKDLIEMYWSRCSLEDKGDSVHYVTKMFSPMVKRGQKSLLSSMD